MASLALPVLGRDEDRADKRVQKAWKLDLGAFPIAIVTLKMVGLALDRRGVWATELYAGVSEWEKPEDKNDKHPANHVSFR
ncbi:hypothetical protein GCM10009091_36540 [Pseudomonas brenneri]|nr:hypothetical protein GCM10009091_36540 [Pseudomonas brenneri]